MQVKEGMEIPGDAVLIEATDITTNEAAMTGETDPMRKEVLSECLNEKNTLI